MLTADARPLVNSIVKNLALIKKNKKLLATKRKTATRIPVKNDEVEYVSTFTLVAMSLCWIVI